MSSLKPGRIVTFTGRQMIKVREGLSGNPSYLKNLNVMKIHTFIGPFLILLVPIFAAAQFSVAIDGQSFNPKALPAVIGGSFAAGKTFGNVATLFNQKQRGLLCR